MTVLDSTPRDQYTATSGQTVFPYTFEIAAAGDIKVLQNGTLINQGAGAGEYAVSGVGVDTGGNVTLVTGATTGDVLTIYRDMALERLTAYTNAGDFLAADVNNDFDRLWLALQQNGGDLDRVLIAPNTDPTSIDMTIPAKADRLGKYLKFNDTTGNPEAGDIAGAFTAAGMNNYNFTGDGATVNFTLGMEPGGENNTQVYIDGVYQQKDTYNVSGTTLTFSTAPPNLSTIEVMVIQVLPVGATTASQVSFTQAGSTYGRNVQLKLQESVSVMDFGATGDGVTDDTAAINLAIASLPSLGGTIFFPEGDYVFEGTINWVHGLRFLGSSRRGTILRSSVAGQLVMGSSATTRYGSIETMSIQTADNSLIPIQMTSCYEFKLINCFLSGGDKTVNIDEGVNISFQGCKFSNSNAGKYCIYANSSTFINALNISQGNRIAGQVYLDTGPTGTSLNIIDGILESGVGKLLEIVRGRAINITGNYFEGYGTSTTVIDIGQNVFGATIGTNYIQVEDSALYVSILIDGSAVHLASQYYGNIGAQDQVTLESNSLRCTVDAGYDGGGTPHMPLVTDNGSLNKVSGYFTKTQFVGASEITIDSNATLDNTKVGAPRIAFADGVVSDVFYMARLPDDVYKTNKVYVDVIYQFDSTDGSNVARVAVQSEPMAIGEAIPALGTSREFSLVADNTVVNEQVDTGDNVPIADQLFLIRFLRDGTSGSDTTTETLYVYGFNIRYADTLGY